MAVRRARQGEDVDSIAFEEGFHPDTLWEDEANRALRELREDPNLLKPGDEVVIPARRPRWETVSTGARHRFHRRGVPAALRIQFREDDEPRGSTPYLFRITTRCGTPVADVRSETDENGFLLEAIPPNTTGGEIILDPGEGEERFPFRLGYIDPPEDGFRGVQAMLNNMGYFCGDENDELDEATIEGVREFQDHVMGLGEEELLARDAEAIDETTLAAIKEAYTAG